mgnify:CR=1 FL=1
MATQQREEIKQLDQSYSAIVKRQFRKNRLAVWSLRIIYLIIFIGLLADFLANDKPIYCKIDGQSYFPIFKSYAVDLGVAKWQPELAKIIKWSNVDYDNVIFPPIPYSPASTDFANAQFVSPLEDQQVKSSFWKHRMGTDDLGRDVFSGMIHGTRIAMLVGIISMTIATIIGIFFGALSGYFGDNKLLATRANLFSNLLFFPFAFYSSFMARSYLIGDAFSQNLITGFSQLFISFVIFSIIMAVVNFLAWLLGKIPFFAKRVKIPIDILVMRSIEVLRSVPTLLLILSIVAVFKPSIYLVMIIIGLTGWTGIARFVRGELLRVRSLEYIEAAEALGFSRMRIILRHAIPNSLTPVLIAIAFGVASAILTEASLSFLGIGVPADTITWGKLLSKSRSATEAWWLAIIPGFAIFITVTIFNLLGDGLADAIDPRLKQ